MKEYGMRLKKQVVAVLIIVMIMSVFVPIQAETFGSRQAPLHHPNEGNIIDVIFSGIAATDNSHPFAIELQNIIDNLPAGYELISATLINLDRRGEHQGVWVLTYNYDEPWGMPHGMIIYMYNGRIRSQDYGMVRPWFMNLTSYNMLQHADGHVFEILGLYNGNVVPVLLQYDDHLYGRFLLFEEEVSGERFNELIREWGAAEVGDSFVFPNQTAQILAMQVSTATLVPTQNNAITVTINSTPVNFADQPPTIVNGRTLVPVRGVFEALGFEAFWNEQARQVTLTRASDTVLITIDSATFITNGVSHTLDVPAQIISGRTMVPIRAVLESVGYDLEWNEATRTAIIITN